MILLFLLFSLVSAHVPTFENSEAFDIEDKSWGIYKELDKGESFSVLLDVKKGNNISFSVSLAGSQEIDKDETYADISLFGHNASEIDCDPLFNGWGYRKLDAKQDETKNIPYEYGGLHFEPFGVGLYRTVASCQAPVPVADDRFNVTVTALKVIDDKLRISIGAGMEESFTALEILLLPITITQTWWWDQFFVYFVGAHAVSFLIIAASFYKCIPLSPKNITIALILHSVFVFGCRFLFVFWDTDLSDTDDSYDMALLTGICLHVALPALAAFAVFVGYWKGPSNKYLFYFAHVVLFVYCSLFVVQAFWLAGISVLVLIWKKYTSKGPKDKVNYSGLNGVRKRMPPVV